MKHVQLLAACAALLLSGCATIVEGTKQEIYLNVTPENATCEAWRNGRVIAQNDDETHIMTVSKSRDNMTIICSAPGYREKRVRVESSASAWGVVGALTLDFGIVDYSTGALNKYDGTITIVMQHI